MYKFLFKGQLTFFVCVRGVFEVLLLQFDTVQLCHQVAKGIAVAASSQPSQAPFFALAILRRLRD